MRYLFKASIMIFAAWSSMASAQLAQSGSDKNVREISPMGLRLKCNVDHDAAACAAIQEEIEALKAPAKQTPVAPAWNPSLQEFNAERKHVNDDPGYRAILACGGADEIIAAKACVVRNFDYNQGTLTVPKDLVKAVKYYSYGCDAGNAMGCLAAALITQGVAGPDAPIDLPAARASYSKGCLYGNAASCLRGGVMLVRGEGGAADSTQGTTFLKKSCAMGEARACKMVEPVAAAASAPAPAFNPSLDDFNRSAKQMTPEFIVSNDCNIKRDAKACGHYGRMLLQGSASLAKDVAKSVTFLTRGCDGGDMMACAYLGNVMQGRAGPEVTVDLSAARAAYGKACSRGDANSCASLGKMTFRGEGGAADAQQAEAYFVRACTLGLKKACAAVEAVKSARAEAGQ